MSAAENLARGSGVRRAPIWLPTCGDPRCLLCYLPDPRDALKWRWAA